jgi:hypothetical protein
VKLIGVDHVGISSDFDGGGGVDGWNSAAEAFNVTLELVRRGYTEEIGKCGAGIFCVSGERLRRSRSRFRESRFRGSRFRDSGSGFRGFAVPD